LSTKADATTACGALAEATDVARISPRLSAVRVSGFRPGRGDDLEVGRTEIAADLVRGSAAATWCARSARRCVR
jgi:hypothetical protein